MLNNIHDVISRLAVIKNMGWVKTLRSGSTGIGYTLETLLEIEENNFHKKQHYYGKSRNSWFRLRRTFFI